MGAAGVLLLLLAGLGYCAVAPTSADAFRQAAVETAQAAHDAVRTADLTGAAVAEHRATGPYAAVLLDSSTRSLASAVRTFAEEPPPDRAATALRDELLPLLTEAVRLVGDAAAAPGHRDGLAPLADTLHQFIQRHR